MFRARNAIPSILALAPAILLPLAQDLLRPRLSRSGCVGTILGSASDFIVGFCVPFAAVMRPRLFRERTARRAFLVCCGLTLAILVLFEFWDPFGRNIRDPNDIVASVLGVGLALVVFHFGLRHRLDYAPSLEVTAGSEAAGPHLSNGGTS